MSYDEDYGIARNHPADPRTSEDDGHQDWLDGEYTAKLIGEEETQEVLTTLMTHPELAKKKLDEYLAEAWMEKREKDAAEDAANEYQDREAA
jgi:hypothetical protein